jgi:DNA-directed RNA polymerase specialized sigma24 family protein
MPRMKKKTEYYVNNKEFLEAITVYRNSVIKAREIATHLSYKPNFVNYMFREDMICDGIENCLQYIDNFDPTKSSNPFAYFTQIIYYAFLRRIQKEKKQMEIKNKILEKSGYDEVMHTDTYDGTMSGMNASQAEMGSIKENIEIKMNR